MFMNHTYNKFIDKFKFDLEDFATIVVQSYAKVGNIYYIKYLYFQKFHSPQVTCAMEILCWTLCTNS